MLITSFFHSDYSIIMPAAVFLKESFEVHVAVGERTHATISTCELKFYDGQDNVLHPFHVERFTGNYASQCMYTVEPEIFVRDSFCIIWK